MQAAAAGQQGSPLVSLSCPGHVELSPQPGLRGHASQIPEPSLHSASCLVFQGFGGTPRRFRSPLCKAPAVWCSALYALPPRQPSPADSISASQARSLLGSPSLHGTPRQKTGMKTVQHEVAAASEQFVQLQSCRWVGGLVSGTLCLAIPGRHLEF